MNAARFGKLVQCAGVFASMVASTAGHAGPTNVPLRATIVTEETLRGNPVACPAPPYLAGTTIGTGNASHLGRVTLTATDCVTPGPTSFTFSGGTLTLTAANGDTLSATYGGSLLPTASGDSVFSITGSFVVTGGTGRFRGASGSGYLQGSQDVLTGKASYEINGALSY